MKQQNYIEELQKIIPLNLEQIETWLFEKREYVKSILETTECYKWKRWQSDKSTHIFPCVCSKREDDCVFIELYYELSKITKQEYSSNTEFIDTNILELLLITQNEPYKRIKFLIKTD